jgi:hypothetical protein
VVAGDLGQVGLLLRGEDVAAGDDGPPVDRYPAQRDRAAELRLVGAVLKAAAVRSRVHVSAVASSSTASGACVEARAVSMTRASPSRPGSAAGATPTGVRRLVAAPASPAVSVFARHAREAQLLTDTGKIDPARVIHFDLPDHEQMSLI